MKNAGNIMLTICASAVLLTACAESGTQSQSENTSSKTETTTTAATESVESKTDISTSDTEKNEKAPYRAKLALSTNGWEITDSETVTYLDDLINSYLPQQEEVSDYDSSQVRNGDTFAVIYSDSYELSIRQSSDNFFNITLNDKSKDADEDGYSKCYLIPQEKLEEIIDVIKTSHDTSNSEKVYYIQHGPSDPADDSKKWVISDEDTVRKIDEWFENISAKLDEYTLEEPEDTSDYSNSTDWYAVSTDETRNDENYFTIDLTYRQYTDEQAESIKGTNAYFNFSYRLENYFIPEKDLSDIYTIITGETLEPAE